MLYQLALLAVSAIAAQAFKRGFDPNPTSGAQVPLGFDGQRFSQSAESHNFTTMSLSALSDDFTVLRHPNFPRHSVRIKKTQEDWCDSTVASFTGYIDTSEARHYFFYFFESRSDPDTDDVIFWTNGGPGCSSSLGLLMELGPCRVVDNTTTKFHPQSWNEKANIFFIDQPIGVGFSYADFGESVGTTQEASQDIASFVAIFFQTFKQFQGRAFHMAGESYGGQYIPIYASAVADQNKALVNAGFEPINLQSVMIGNGMTNTFLSTLSYYDMQCSPASEYPIQSIDGCVRMKTAVPRCESMFKESCIDTFDALGCSAASMFCSNELEAPFYALNLNPYNINEGCTSEQLSDTLCYPVISTIGEYLNQPAVREAIGTSESLKNDTFQGCNNAINDEFSRNLDSVRVQTQFYLEGLLERGVRVLIYVGSLDWICNWVGNYRMTDALEWHGGDAFRAQKLKPWSRVRGEEKTTPAGLTKSHGGLTFLTVYGAGHMVPFDKPDEALEMVDRWLGKRKF